VDDTPAVVVLMGWLSGDCAAGGGGGTILAQFLYIDPKRWSTSDCTLDSGLYWMYRYRVK
jgi:hypothetical protein